MSLTTPDLLVLAAAGTYFLAYLIINQVILRLLVLVGTVCYIGYYATVADEPLWVAIWTSVALGVSNIFGLGLLYGARSRLAIPKAFRALYDEHPAFAAVPPGDFGGIMRAAHLRTFDVETEIMRERTRGGTLFFLLEGSAKAEKLGHKFDLPSGIFMGEVAYILDQNSSATITVAAGSSVLEWRFDALRETSRRKPRFKLALEALMSRDLARKVTYAVAPDIMR